MASVDVDGATRSQGQLLIQQNGNRRFNAWSPMDIIGKMQRYLSALRSTESNVVKAEVLLGSAYGNGWIKPVLDLMNAVTAVYVRYAGTLPLVRSTAQKLGRKFVDFTRPGPGMPLVQPAIAGAIETGIDQIAHQMEDAATAESIYNEIVAA